MLDLEGEQAAVLKALLHTEGLLERCHDRLAPDLFGEDARPIADALLAHFKRFKTLPSQSAMLEALRKMKVVANLRDDVAALYTNGEKHDPKWSAEFVRTFGRRQKVLAALEAMQGADDVDDFVKEVTSAAKWPEGDEDAPRSTGLWSAVKHPPAEREPMPTGLEPVDSVAGGLAKGEFGLLMAPTNQGKSAALIAFGSHAVCRGKLVAHVTLELSMQSTVNRYKMALSSMSVSEQFSQPKVCAKRLEGIRKAGGDVQVWEFPADGVTADDIEAAMDEEEAHRGRKFDLLIVDYLDQVAPTRKAKEYRHELERVTKDLRGIGQRRRIPVWSATQTKRGVEDNDGVSKADVSECKGKIDVADLVMGFVHTAKTPAGLFRSRWFILKTRDTAGAGETFNAEFDFERMSLVAV